jgi:hypothetical protein
MGRLRKLLVEAKVRKLFPGEKTLKVLPEDLKIGDMIVFRAWGADDMDPWLKQVRSVTDPGYAIVVGLNADRGFEQKDYPYDKEVEIVERDVD